MNKEVYYSINEVCEQLGITIWTLKNWYSWEKKRIEEGICEKYLPTPIRMNNTKGRPNFWTKDMLEELRDYQNTIIMGRNGNYGMYTNPTHKETKKYKKSLESVEK